MLKKMMLLSSLMLVNAQATCGVLGEHNSHTPCGLSVHNHPHHCVISLQNNVIEEGTSGKIRCHATYGGKKTWIGIYKVGTSNKWKNVHSWTWVKNKTTIDTSNLTEGEYEVRLFFNNSYKTEAKTSLIVTPNTKKAFIKLDKKNGNKSIFISHSTTGHKAWIGIYPKGSTTSWNYVKAWSFAEKDGSTKISVAHLPKGTYEARLFDHNSYVIKDKFTFTLDSASYGNTSHASASYGNTSHASASYDNASHASASYDNASHASASYGNTSHASASYDNTSHCKTSYFCNMWDNIFK